ncbi:carbohydrate kinase [Stappia taiwanensis]|uniref:Carbohydrate kinase n=1 Tax=Stappia taiwanensis TaxID=992267 RepID=A0A838XNT2_9HYPH|nr:carbohydrate kinase [Stappia taiwanensis]MBA4610388.1 carbohydrate kinase [Stappia taiwanensis]GGE85370.1 fructokinase [Stappia taiwanensis]
MILVCGEALFDLFAEEDGDRLTLDARIGGSPVNVAIGLARLATPVSYFGALSGDLFGRRLRTTLAAEGVRLDHVLATDAPTTLSIVGLSAAGSPEYTFHGEGAADRQVRPADLPDLPPEIACIHIGSFAMLVPPVGDSLAALVAREHGRRMIAYDPNIRPTVVADLAAWRARLGALLPHVDLLKISGEDLATLYPDRDAATLAAAWLARGPSLVVVTHGAEGAEAFTGKAHVAIPGHPVAVVDSVGAGDSFQAAMLARLGERGQLSAEALARLDAEDLGDLLHFAASAAALTCTRRGADLPRRAELASACHSAPFPSPQNRGP